MDKRKDLENRIRLYFKTYPEHDADTATLIFLPELKVHWPMPKDDLDPLLYYRGLVQRFKLPKGKKPMSKVMFHSLLNTMFKERRLPSEIDSFIRKNFW